MNDQERYVGMPEWNIAGVSLLTLMELFKAVTVAWLEPDGHPRVAQLLYRIFVMVSPYLNEKEMDKGLSYYSQIFEGKYQIKYRSGGGYEIYKRTEDLMREWELWLWRMIRVKGLLQKFGEDPSEAII